MNVRWSARALAQLSAAHAYLRQENPPAARNFLESVGKIIGLMREFPGIGVETDEPGIRMFPLVQFRYLIFYQIRGEELRILRVRHASRNRT
jgi:plasmid stabilization system protein ParE